jgi:hypothetical protein
MFDERVVDVPTGYGLEIMNTKSIRKVIAVPTNYVKVIAQPSCIIPSLFWLKITFFVMGFKFKGKKKSLAKGECSKCCPDSFYSVLV